MSFSSAGASGLAFRFGRSMYCPESPSQKIVKRSVRRSMGAKMATPVRALSRPGRTLPCILTAFSRNRILRFFLMASKTVGKTPARRTVAASLNSVKVGMYVLPSAARFVTV